MLHLKRGEYRQNILHAKCLNTGKCTAADYWTGMGSKDRLRPRCGSDNPQGIQCCYPETGNTEVTTAACRDGYNFDTDIAVIYSPSGRLRDQSLYRIWTLTFSFTPAPSQTARVMNKWPIGILRNNELDYVKIWSSRWLHLAVIHCQQCRSVLWPKSVV